MLHAPSVPHPRTVRTLLLAIVWIFVAVIGQARQGKVAYTQGKAAYDAGQYTQAMPLFQQAVQDPAYAAKGNYMLALCYRKQGGCDKAAVYFKRALVADPTAGGASSAAKFDEKLAECKLTRAGLAQVADAGIAATPADAQVVPAVAGDVFLQEYVVQLANGVTVVDLSGQLAPGEREQLQAHLQKAGTYLDRVLLLAIVPASSAEDLQQLAQKLAAPLTGSPKPIVMVEREGVLALSEQVDGLSQALSASSAARLKRDAAGSVNYRALTAALDTVKAPEPPMSPWVWAGPGIGLLAALAIAFVVRARRRKAQAALDEASRRDYLEGELRAIHDVLFNDELWATFLGKHDPAAVERVRLSWQLEYSGLTKSPDAIAIRDLKEKIRKLELSPSAVFTEN